MGKDEIKHYGRCAFFGCQYHYIMGDDKSYNDHLLKVHNVKDNRALNILSAVCVFLLIVITLSYGYFMDVQPVYLCKEWGGEPLLNDRGGYDCVHMSSLGYCVGDYGVYKSTWKAIGRDMVVDLNNTGG